MTDAMTERAHTIISGAESKKLSLRLLGGLAIRMRSPTATKNAANRPILDLDFFGLSKQRGPLDKLFIQVGLDPYENFNRLHGDQRLIYDDTPNKFTIDIFLDKFEMCHTFDFRDRLHLDKTTLSLADLMVTKLQIVELNEKDLMDLVCLLYDHELSNDDTDVETINADYIANLCADDWGICKTFTMNLQRILDRTNVIPLDDESLNVARKRTEALRNAIDSKKKTLRWRLRAKVGDSKQWYNTPEERRK